jgi:2,3-bisphosphoglycerate-dependent phosphoglycerate mutase
MERAILTRHGESEYSVRGLLNGDPTVPCGLTEAGLAQASALARALANTELDLCVTSEFERAHLTARPALAGRELETVVLPGLNDPRYGVFEGDSLEAYRRWADSASSADPAPGGGESRLEIARRYAEAYRALLRRPEPSLLVVIHSLPVAFALAAAAGEPPRRRAEMAPYATPFTFERPALESVVSVFERWLSAPDW